MAKNTDVGKSVSQYTRATLDEAQKAADAARAAGYPKESSYEQAYFAGVPSLYMYGDPEQKKALDRSMGMYGKYLDAGKYNKTDFSGLKSDYAKAGRYNAADYGDLENEYSGIGDYTPTQYGDIENQYASQMGYDPREYEMADYTTKNIQDRMSPYEELVSKQAEKRLKRGYDEARGEREAQAVRSGAFGGSGAAVQEEAARRNYLEQAEDMNAKNLQAAFESGAGLYSKEMADRLAAGQAEEASRQFGSTQDMNAIQGQLAARNAQQNANEFQKQLELDVMSGKMTARQAEEASRQFAKNAQFTGLAGQMDAQKAAAAETAAAKEAEFTGLHGASDTINQEANLAQQRKNMQIANLTAMQQAGEQKRNEAMDRNMYGLNISTAKANIAGGLQGGVAPLPSQRQQQPSGWQQALSTGASLIGTAVGAFGRRDGGLIERYANGGLAQGFDLYRAGTMLHHYMNGGLASIPNDTYNMRYNGGGLADLEPEYYSGYEF